MASGAGQLLPTRPAAAPQRRRRPLPHGPRLSYLHPRPTPPHAPPRPVCEAEAYLEQKGLKQFTRRTGVAAKPSNLPQINLGWGCNFKGVSGAQPPRPAAGNGRCVLNRARATPCQGLKGIFAGQTAVKGVVKKGLPLLPDCYEGGRAARRRGVAFVVHISFWAACAVADYGPLVVPQRVQSAVRPAPVPLRLPSSACRLVQGAAGRPATGRRVQAQGMRAIPAVGESVAATRETHAPRAAAPWGVQRCC